MSDGNGDVNIEVSPLVESLDKYGGVYIGSYDSRSGGYVSRKVEGAAL